MSAAPRGYVMAFDFGLRHIGVALGQTVTATASGIATLKARAGKPDWRALQALLHEYTPVAVVVGLPLNMDGTLSPMAEKAKRFAAQLEQRIGLPVELHDERLTSRDAHAGFEEAQALGRAATEHELAACLILQSWFSTIA